MIKYRIVYIGDNKYLGWDADAKRFVPAYMHLYVSTYTTLEECMKEAHSVKKSRTGWADDIYIDSVNRDPLGEHKPF